jgi:oligosaccharide repeat unit polymerase
LRPSILIALGCSLGAALALYAAVAGPSPDASLLLLAAFPALGLLVYGLYKVTGFLKVSRLGSVNVDVFSPLVAFPVLYLAWFALGSIDMIDVPQTISFGLFEPIPGYVMGYAALGLAGYLAGAALRRPKQAGNHEEGSGQESPEKDRSGEFTWLEDRFGAVTAGLGTLMFVSYLYIVASMGAIPALSADAGEIRLRILRSGSAEAVMFTCAWSLIPMLTMYVWCRRPRRTVKILCYAGVAISFLLLLSLGGRSYLIVPLLTTLVARHYGKRRFAIGKLALICTALFCGLSLFGYVRDTALNGSEFGEDRMGVPGAVVPFVYAYLYVRYPVATFRDISAIVPEKIPYQYGALSFGPLATLLPGHHEQSDMFFKNILGSDFLGAGQPATLLGPLYADAGWLGIVAGLFLSGMLISNAHAWMLAAPSVIRVLLYAWGMQTLLLSLFSNLFPYITTLWIPLFWMVLHLILRRPRHAVEPLPPLRPLEAHS